MLSLKDLIENEAEIVDSIGGYGYRLLVKRALNPKDTFFSSSTGNHIDIREKSKEQLDELLSKEKKIRVTTARMYTHLRFSPSSQSLNTLTEAILERELLETLKSEKGIIIRRLKEK